MFGWGEGGAHSPLSGGIRVTLCDLIWQVAYRSSEMCSLKAVVTFNIFVTS